jgi:hypothetical protein
MNKPMADTLSKVYGYGSGTYGEISMADIMGTCAGYVHEHTFPTIIDCMKYLTSRSESTQYIAGGRFLRHLTEGKYTTIVTSGSGSPDPGPDVTTYTYTVPKGEPGYTDGFIGTFSGGTTNDYTAAVQGLVPYIEAGIKTIFDACKTDPDLNACMTAMEAAHAASCAQMIREIHLCNQYNIDLTGPTKVTPLTGYIFAFTLTNNATETGHGQMADWLDRVAYNTLGGDAIRGALRMARNAKKLQPLGVNLDKYILPISQYYRDPLGLTESLYQGLVPPTPLFTQDAKYPINKVQQYIIHRDGMLVDTGLVDDTMTAALKDELYVDTYWRDKPEDVLLSMGYSAVSAALNRNLKLIGNELVMIDLSGKRTTIGKITVNGISNLDTDTLITTLFMVVNRILYGDIGVSKYTTPFYTDDLIYGVADYLATINSTNVEVMVNTLLATQAMGQFVTNLANKFRNLKTVFETSIDRNKFGAYGGVGPETRLDLP